MAYVDTSVLVPLFLHEPHSGAAAEGYAREKRELVAAARRAAGSSCLEALRTHGGC